MNCTKLFLSNTFRTNKVLLRRNSVFVVRRQFKSKTVGDLMQTIQRPLVTVDSSMTLEQALSEMDTRHTDSALVTKTSQPVGKFLSS
jgi:CBS domain containing-hemolysin-like protein